LYLVMLPRSSRPSPSLFTHSTQHSTHNLRYGCGASTRAYLLPLYHSRRSDLYRAAAYRRARREGAGPECPSWLWNTLSSAPYGEFLLLLTFDHQDNVSDDVWDLNVEAEGANIVYEAYECVRKSRHGGNWRFVRTWLDKDLHVGAGLLEHALGGGVGAHGGGGGDGGSGGSGGDGGYFVWSGVRDVNVWYFVFCARGLNC
jgi:hypothetical protein